MPASQPSRTRRGKSKICLLVATRKGVILPRAERRLMPC
jgi:hypothetical protein